MPAGIGYLIAVESIKIVSAEAQLAAAALTLSSSPSISEDIHATLTFSMEAGDAFSPPPFMSTAARALGI